MTRRMANAVDPGSHVVRELPIAIHLFDAACAAARHLSLRAFPFMLMPRVSGSIETRVRTNPSRAQISL